MTYNQLTSEQRYTISILLQHGMKQNKIAEALKVSPSTISRELRRNQHIGKKVNILYNSSMLEIYLKYEKIAAHARNYKPYGYTYNADHLASCQRVMTEWNPNKFLQEAASIHPDVENYIRQVIETKNHPEQAYKSCRGILNFASRAGRERLINACRWASCYGLYNYPAIDKILKNRQDELPMEEYEDSSQERSMPAHENIRGKDYYN